MNLVSDVVPAKVVRSGSQTAEMTAPQSLKVQTTGPNAAMWFEDGPAQGKRWNVTVWVRVVEYDA